MKKIVVIISVCAVICVSLGSCWVETGYGYHEHHERGWHHEGREHEGRDHDEHHRD